MSEQQEHGSGGRAGTHPAHPAPEADEAREVPEVSGTREAREAREINRANWEDRADVHARSAFYDLPGFRAGASTLRPYEPDEVGEVAGRSLLHLQCHMGQDTLSWARLGARVTGLDFSARAVATARRLAADTGLSGRARFVVADVHEAARALAGERFDIVYTGIGALVWLPDLDRWAGTVASLLKPGGFLYLVELHPVAEVLGDDGRTVEYDYFDRRAQEFDSPHSYTGTDHELTSTRSVQWQHGVGDVVTALARAGLRVEFLHERPSTLFARFPVLEGDGGEYRYPAGVPGVPLSYSLRASR